MSQHGQRTLTTKPGKPQSQSAVSPFVLVIAEGDSSLHSVGVDAALTAASVIGALRSVRLRVCRADTSLTPPPPSSSADHSTADTSRLSSQNVKDHSRPSSYRNVKDHGRRRFVRVAADVSPLQRSASCVPPKEAPAEDDEDEEGLLSRSLSDAPSGMFHAAKNPLHKGVGRLLAPLDENAEEEMDSDVWREAELDEQYKGAPRAVVVLISRRFMQQEGCQYRLLSALQSAGEARCIPVVVDRHACNPRKWTAIVRNALSHRLYVPLFADAPASERSAALRAIVSEVRRAAPELPRWPPVSSTLPSRATAASPAGNDAVAGLALLLHTSAVAAENEAVLHVRPGTAVPSVSSSPSPICDDGVTPLVLPEPARAHIADAATTTAADCSQPTPLPSAAASPRRNVVVGLRSLPPSPLPTFAPRRPSPNSAASGQDTSGAAALFDTRSVEDWLKAETWEGDQQAAGKPFLMDWVASRRKWLFMQPEGTPLIVRADGSLADHPTSHSQDAIAGMHARHRLLTLDCRKLERRRLDGGGSGSSMRAALYDGATDMACPSDEDTDPEANHRRGIIPAATPAHNPVEAMAGQTCGNGADARSDTLDAQTIGFNHKDVGDVVAVLYSQARSAAAVTRACLALRDLTVEDDHARVEVARRGGLEAIVLRMREHLTHPRLLENACRAFINLAVNDDNELTIVARGGVDAIVMAMRAFPDDCALQTQGCWSLRNLAFNPLNKRAVAGRGGLDAVLKAMRNHAHRHDGCEVQEHGCWAIRNLSADDNNKAAIAASGGIEATLDAMRLHHDRAAVQKQGCGALANLGANPANRIAIGRLRGVETIVVALRTHLSNAEVQVQGGWAIKNLAYNGPENRAAVARLNGIEAIKDAIRVHSSHPGVVEQCARALWNLSYENEENQAAILADDGRRLLEAAKATHASRPSVVEAVVGALNNLNTATASRAS